MGMYLDVSAMKGEVLTGVSGMEVGSDRVRFETASGRVFTMYHQSDCCESVSIEDVTGNVADLIGVPLLMSEEESNSDDPKPSEGSESWTWTFYRFATVRGYVTLRWLGESNGYYSESVTFVEEASNG